MAISIKSVDLNTFSFLNFLMNSFDIVYSIELEGLILEGEVTWSPYTNKVHAVSLFQFY